MNGFFVCDRITFGSVNSRRFILLALSRVLLFQKSFAIKKEVKRFPSVRYKQKSHSLKIDLLLYSAGSIDAKLNLFGKMVE